MRVYVLNDRNINAFVAGGQRVFINTGLIMESDTPNELIGVLAHETGHIAGGHLARMGVEIDSASYTTIIGMLLGLAAIAGGVAAGSAEVAQAGQGIMMGSKGLAQRNFLTYARGMEASADQAALRYLKDTQQSARGMITLFEKLASQNIAALANVDPYVMSHPMPMERIRNLEVEAQKSPYWNTKDPPPLVLRHELAQAKLTGYIGGAQAVMQRYPSADQSMPARYARAIAMFRRGDINNALPIIDGLIKELPENPYFWELKGQALLENGRAAEAVVPVQKALQLLPKNGAGLYRHRQARQRQGSDQAAAPGAAFRRRHGGDLPAAGPCLCPVGRHSARRTCDGRGRPADRRPPPGHGEGEVGAGRLQDRNPRMDPGQRRDDLRGARLRWTATPLCSYQNTETEDQTE